MLIGVVGKANVGKSTFFKAATLAEVEIANYPFVTIKPNHGIGFVSVECVDKEFNIKCNPRFGYCIDSERFLPIDMMDVAGLIPGAHEGKGMGNQFLDDLRQADALIHIVDIAGSTNEKGEPIAVGSYEPANDIRFLEFELDMWYLRLITKGWEDFAKKVKQEKSQTNKALTKHLSSLGVTEKLIEATLNKMGLDADITKWNKAALKDIAVELRKATKPMIIAANKIDAQGAEKNLERIKKEFPDYIIIPCSAESELALREAAKHNLIKYIAGENNFQIIAKDKLNEKQLNALSFIKKNVLEKYSSTGVEQVLDEAVFKLLNHIAVYPVENEGKLTDSENRVLPDCYLLPKGSTALDLAFKIHTDIGNKFNCAIDVKTKKRVGRDYVLKHRDVIKIVA